MPHLVFLTDDVARGPRAGIGTGAAYWVLFGLSAAMGAAILGLVPDRTEFAAALHGALVLQPPAKPPPPI